MILKCRRGKPSRQMSLEIMQQDVLSYVFEKNGSVFLANVNEYERSLVG